jgi:hypothetical protein
MMELPFFNIAFFRDTTSLLSMQYATSKNIHNIFLELLQQLLRDRPDNPLSYLALAAHNLHKSPPPGLLLPTSQ